MDPITLTALITAVGSCIVSVLTHLKYSKCCGFEIETKTPLLGKNIQNLTKT